MDNPSSQLSAEARRHLSYVRGRRESLHIWNLFFALSAVLLILVSLAMMIDWYFACRSSTLRMGISVSVCGGCLLLGRWVWRKLPFDGGLRSTAKWLDEVNPALQERLSTVVELTGKDSHSPDLLGAVGKQVDLIGVRDNPRRAILAKPFVAAVVAVVCAFVLLGIVKSISGSNFVTLLDRLVRPWSNRTLTVLTEKSTAPYHAKGRPFDVAVAISGKIPSQAILEHRAANGTVEQREITLDRASGTLRTSIPRVEKNFAYRVIAGDGATPWHEVIVIDRPQLKDVKLVVTPPTYTKVEERAWTALPRRVEVPEGSKLSLSFAADQKLPGAKIVQRGAQKELTSDLLPDKGGRFQFDTSLAESVQDEIQLTSVIGDLQARFPITIAVKADQKPQVRLLDSTETFAMKADETLHVAFQAVDDYGIISAELVAELTKADGTKTEFRFPVDLQGKAGEKDIQATTSLDLKQIPLQKGDDLQIAMEVRDQRGHQANNPAEAQQRQKSLDQEIARLKQMLADALKLNESLQAAQDSNDKALAVPKESASDPTGQNPPVQPNVSQGQQGSPKKPEVDDVLKLLAQKIKDAEAIAKNLPGNEERAAIDESIQKADQAAKQARAHGLTPERLGNVGKALEKALEKLRTQQDVEGRMLDVATGEKPPTKSASAKVTVDELAEYRIAGDGNKKQQIAIQEVLDLILESAVKGRKRISLTGTPPKPGEDDGRTGKYAGLVATQAPLIQAALKAGADGAEKLRQRSEGTPYAFFGLQAKALVETGFSPALEAIVKALESADAREKAQQLLLADERLRWVISQLEKNKKQFEQMIEYEKVLELSYQFKKMHEITLEDMPPPEGCRSSPYPKLKGELSDKDVQRKIAQLKLKREVLKRLSELLQKNPELRARHLAQSSEAGKIYREELSRLRNCQQQIVEATASLTQMPMTSDSPGAATRAIPPLFSGMLRQRLLKFSSHTTEALGLARIWIPTETPPGQRKELEDAIARLSQGVEQLAAANPLAKDEFEQAVASVRKTGVEADQILSKPEWKENYKDYSTFRSEDLVGMTTELDACDELAKSLRNHTGHLFLGRLQQELNDETRSITLNMMNALGNISGVSPKADQQIEALNKLLAEQLYPSQKQVFDSLSTKDMKRAKRLVNATHTAVSALEKATHLLDSAITEFVRAQSEQEALAQQAQAPHDDAQPLPDPTQNEIEEELAKLLRSLEEESRKSDDIMLGIGRVSNVIIKVDWEKSRDTKDAKQSKSEKEALAQQREMQMKDAQQAAIAAGKAQSMANDKALNIAHELSRKPVVPWKDKDTLQFEGRNDWNTIKSQLKESLTQDIDSTVPEEYRTAIENYFRTISEANSK